MTAHTCPTYDPSCYRCDLGRDEERSAQMDALREAASDARHNSFNGANEWEDALADLFDATLRGLAPERMSLSIDGPYAQSALQLAQRYLEWSEDQAEVRG